MNKVATACSIVLSFVLGVLVGDMRHVSPVAGSTLAPEPSVVPSPSPSPLPAAAPTVRAAAPSAPAPAAEAPDDHLPQQDSDRIPVGDSPALGPATAIVTIVEFSDFECSYCAEAETTLRQIRERLGDRVRLVWKNNPLLPIHPNAPAAAEAAMEAYAQGGAEKFWRMHDLLYQNQTALDRPSIDRHAQTLGLNMARYRRAMDAHTHQAAIDRDKALLEQLGGRGTPIFFVNGTIVRGAQPPERLTSAVDAALARARTIQPRSRAYAQMVTDALAAVPAERVEDPNAVYRVPVGSSPVLGSNDALVTVVVFSDFQCPFCARSEVTLRALRTRYGNDIRFVWKNEPLAMHPLARPAAQVAMEALAQGGSARFWRAHDLLFEHSDGLERPALEGYARQLGLDAARVRAALDGNTHDAAINADHALAQQLGVSGTPAFYINGRRLVGAKPEDAFVRVIDDVRRQALERLRTVPGTTRANLYERIIADGATSLAYIGGAAAAADRAYTVRPSATAPFVGGASARVVIEHFSDFQCPFCGRVGPVMEQIRQRYGNRVKLVWRNFPLRMHPNAMIAAEAAMEVYAQQGNTGFWTFHDLLFQHQEALDRPQLEQYAQQQHLDMARFRAAMDAHTHQAAIQDDMLAASATGAEIAMPASFINGHLVVGAQPIEEFTRRIDAALAAP